MEDIYALDGGFSALLASKNEVNPLVEMATDIRALESLSVLSYEGLGISFSPWRQLDIIDPSAITLSHAEIISVDVSQKLWEVEELRDEFSDISHIVPRCRLPGFLD
jgi:hypothetical protein